MIKKKTGVRKKNQAAKPAARLTGRKLYVLFAAVIIVVALIVLILRSGKDNSVSNTNLPVRHTSGLSFTKHGELSFVSTAGEQRTTIDIEIADDLYKIAQGLMFRDSLAENQGMLFIFADEDYRMFWMKNTSIPLDMIFISAAREIVDIHKFTTPFSEQNYHSDRPARYVVEVNAGFTDKYHIGVDDKIIWSKTESMR